MKMLILVSLVILLLGSPALAAQEVKDNDLLVVQTLWNLEDQLLQLINEEGSRPERNVLQDLGIEPKIYAIISLMKIKHLHTAVKSKNSRFNSFFASIHLIQFIATVSVPLVPVFHRI